MVRPVSSFSREFGPLDVGNPFGRPIDPSNGRSFVRMIHRRKFLKKAALLVVSTALCIVLLDGLLWLVHPLPSGQSARWIWKHDIAGLKHEVVFEKYLDLRGLSWNEQSPLRKPAGTFRVLIVGASTTESSQQEPQDAWWGLLEQRLQQQPEFSGKAVQVLAFGQGGFEVSDDATWLKHEFSELTPDVLITLVGVNDVAFPEHSDSDLPGMYRLRGFLRKVSQIYRHASAIKLKWDLSRGVAVKWITAQDMKKVTEELRSLPLSEPASRHPDPLPGFVTGLHSIIKLAKQNGVPVLLLGQPVLWKEEMTPEEDSVRWFRHYEGQVPFRASGGWMYREMQRFNEAQRKAAAETGTCYLNLDQVAPKSLEVFYDDCHFTDAGSIKVAEAVLPAVVECLRK